LPVKAQKPSGFMAPPPQAKNAQGKQFAKPTVQQPQKVQEAPVDLLNFDAAPAT